MSNQIGCSIPLPHSSYHVISCKTQHAHEDTHTHTHIMKNHEAMERFRKRPRIPRKTTKEAKHFRVISSILALVLMGSVAPVSSLSTREARQIILSSETSGSRQARQLDAIMELIRGGGAGDDDKGDDQETAELDAYIEQLIGEVDGDEVEEDVKIEKTKTKENTFDEKDEKSSKKNVTDMETKTKATSKKTSATAHSTTKQADEKKIPGGNKSKPKSAKKSKLPAAVGNGIIGKSTETTKSPVRHINQTEDTINIRSHAMKVATNATTTTIPPAPSDEAQPRQRPPPPNALYRFLLRRAGGFGGRSTILLLVTASEFLHTYLPPIAHVGDWALSKIFPAPKDGTGRRRRPNRPAPSSVNVASVTRMARTGVPRSKRRKFTQQADQMALTQLKQRSTAELRYAFCSEAFRQRHGLGKWTSLANKNVDSGTHDAEEKEVEHSVQVPGVDLKPAKKRKKKQDWVLAALTKEPRRKRSPTLSLNVGSDGLTIGVDLDWSGQKERVRAALTVPPKSTKALSKKQSNTTQRKSDSDSGMVGRLRAAAGSSMRSLSGAYPGDALSTDVAGNSRGLGDFAAKYGYGDWSDSDDDNLGMDGIGGGARPKRPRRRRKPIQKKEYGNFWDDVDVSFSSSSSSDRRRHHAPRTTRPKTPLSTSLTQTRTKKHDSLRPSRAEKNTPQQENSSKSPAKAVAPRTTIMAKSPLARTKELKKKASELSSDD